MPLAAFIAHHKLLIASWGLLFATDVMDAHSSMRPGLYETNPVLAHGGHYTAMSAFQETSGVVVAIGIESLLMRKHHLPNERAVTFGNLAYTGYIGAEAIHNMRIVIPPAP